MDRISVIDERMEQLKVMANNCCRIIGLYSRMNHPNRENLASVYETGLQNLTREYKELETEREELKNKMKS